MKYVYIILNGADQILSAHKTKSGATSHIRECIRNHYWNGPASLYRVVRYLRAWDSAPSVSIP